MVSKITSGKARTKLSFIVGLLLIPMAILGYLMASQMRQSIEFAEKELVGVEFGKAFRPLMLKLAKGEPLQAESDDFNGKARDLAAELGMRGEFMTFVNLLKRPDMPAIDLVRAGQRLLVTAADRSNLVLDPVGETYHLATLSAVYAGDMISDLVEVLSELRGENLQASGQLLGVSDVAFQLGRLSESARRLQTATVAAATWTDQPKTYNELVKVSQHLAEDPAEFAWQVLNRTNAIKSGSSAAPQVMADESKEFANHILGDTDEAWLAGSAKLEALLNARVSDLESKLFLMLLGSGAAALIALATAAFMFGSTLSELDKVEAAYDQSQAAKAEAEAMSLKMQSVNEDISVLNRSLADNVQKLREAQDEIVKKGKMAQLGQLVATVAHELRNPLGAVRTSVFLLERKIQGKAAGVEPQFERINKGIVRCDNIITQLLDFARSKDLFLKNVGIDEWVTKVVEEEAGKLPAEVSIECELGLGNHEAMIDEDRMSRVIINLMANASEAMVGKGDKATASAASGPRIQIKTRRTYRGIEISVRDNGPGMTDEVRARVLEPLFTTKNFGTGLGLPAVEKIVEQHGGGLDIETALGQGSCFSLWIPERQQSKEAA